jgi:hypothetical protein
VLALALKVHPGVLVFPGWELPESAHPSGLGQGSSRPKSTLAGVRSCAPSRFIGSGFMFSLLVQIKSGGGRRSMALPLQPEMEIYDGSRRCQGLPEYSIRGAIEKALQRSTGMCLPQSRYPCTGRAATGLRSGRLSEKLKKARVVCHAKFCIDFSSLYSYTINN